MNVDFRCRGAEQSCQGREISVRAKKQGADITGGLHIARSIPSLALERANTVILGGHCAALRRTLFTIRPMT